MLKLKRLLHELPEHHFETFKHLAKHLNRVAVYGDVNRVSTLDPLSGLQIRCIIDFFYLISRAFSSNFFGKGSWPKLGKNDRLNMKIGRN